MKMGPRIFLPILVVALVLAMAATTLAVWPKFQYNSANNAVVPTAPPTASPSATAVVDLPFNGTAGVDVFAGVDTPSVINAGVSYTLYNGGNYNPANTSGGARIAAVDLPSPSPTPDWTYPLDARAGNTQQLSTMYLDAATPALYAATTHYTNELNGTSLAGWTDANGNQLTSPVTFEPDVPQTIHYRGLFLPSAFRQFQIATDIDYTPALGAETTADVTLTSRADGTPFDLGTSTYYGFGKWTLYNNNDVLVPAGQYDIAITFTVDENETADVELSSLSFLTTRWSLYKVTGFSGSETAPTAKTMLAAGYGQANTPIYRHGSDDYLYFGIYEGDRSYYQYRLSTGALTAFKPNGGDDFYWAGAVVVPIDNTDYAVFGGDSSNVYVREVGANFNSVGYSHADVTGKIRSTVCYAPYAPPEAKTPIHYLYFTSRDGVLWRVDKNDLLGTPAFTDVELAGNSVSTPVVSGQSPPDQFIYVGSSAGVQAVSVSGFSSPITIFSGAQVTASPILYSDTTPEALVDYIYFTTNAFAGAGYCYAHDISNTSVDEAWSVAGTSDNRFALQGFASDNGVLVYGDDGNSLYVIK